MALGGDGPGRGALRGARRGAARPRVVPRRRRVLPAADRRGLQPLVRARPRRHPPARPALGRGARRHAPDRAAGPIATSASCCSPPGRCSSWPGCGAGRATADWSWPPPSSSSPCSCCRRRCTSGTSFPPPSSWPWSRRCRARSRVLFVVLTVTATLNQGLDLGRAVLDHAVVVDPSRVADPPAIRMAIRNAATVVALVHVALLAWWTAVYRRELAALAASAPRRPGRAPMTAPRIWVLRALLLAPLVPLVAGPPDGDVPGRDHDPPAGQGGHGRADARRACSRSSTRTRRSASPWPATRTSARSFPTCSPSCSCPCPPPSGCASRWPRCWRTRARGAGRARKGASRGGGRGGGDRVRALRRVRLHLAVLQQRAGPRPGAVGDGGGGHVSARVPRRRAPRRRRAVAELALVSGLEILAGEPVIALMSFGLAGLRVLMGPARRRALVGRRRRPRPRRRDRGAADREHGAGLRDLDAEPRARSRTCSPPARRSRPRACWSRSRRFRSAVPTSPARPASPATRTTTTTRPTSGRCTSAGS